MYVVFLFWFIVSFMFKMKIFIDEILEFINKLYYMYFILYYNIICKYEIVCFDLVYILKWSWIMLFWLNEMIFWIKIWIIDEY